MLVQLDNVLASFFYDMRIKRFMYHIRSSIGVCFILAVDHGLPGN